MLKDCCFTRDIKSHDEIALTECSIDKQEIEILFRDNTKKAPSLDDNSSLPASGLSATTAERLKIEFRFIKHLMRLVNDQKRQDALNHF
jgi:hypothetical protein